MLQAFAKMQSLMAKGMILTLMLVEINNHIIRTEKACTDPQACGLAVRASNSCRYPQRPGCDPLFQTLATRVFNFRILSPNPSGTIVFSYKHSVCRCCFQAKGSDSTKNSVWQLLVVRS